MSDDLATTARSLHGEALGDEVLSEFGTSRLGGVVVGKTMFRSEDFSKTISRAPRPTSVALCGDAKSARNLSGGIDNAVAEAARVRRVGPDDHDVVGAVHCTGRLSQGAERQGPAGPPSGATGP